jgi:hypothetical protein
MPAKFAASVNPCFSRESIRKRIPSDFVLAASFFGRPRCLVVFIPQVYIGKISEIKPDAA